MTRIALSVLITFIASNANAQQSAGLHEDLDRAASRYESTETISSAEDAIALAVEAGTAYREGRLGEAVQGYDRAAGEAYRVGATGRAFEFALVSAEIERGRGNFSDAAGRFQRAAIGNANHPRAASAHHEACVCTQKTLDRNSAASLHAYDQLLTEHLTSWPRAKTAETVRWQRVELLAIRGEWRELIARVRLVEPTDARFARAQELLVFAHQQNLGKNPEALQEATADLQAILLGPAKRWPSQWSSFQRECAIVLARGHLARSEGGADYAAQILRVALRGRPHPSPAWQRQAVSLLVVASLLQEDRQAAAEQLALEIASPEEQHRLIEGIAQRLTLSNSLAEVDRLRATLDALRPLAGEKASSHAPGDLARGDLVQGDLVRAQALAAAGRREEAAAVFTRLVALRNNDRATLTAFAQFLADSRDAESLARSLALWRRIEAQSKRDTGPWFTARLARLRLMAMLGEREQAMKLLQLTRLMAPEMGGSATRAEFDAIAESLR